MNKPKHTFFCPDINSGNLSEEESKHAVRVLRLNEGDFIFIIDGKGRKILAKIKIADKKKLIYSIESEETESKPAVDIHIAIAPTKNNDRFSFFLEKVTEIGISKISPIICNNSERKDLNLEKLKKNLVSAIKQSGNFFIPEISLLQNFNDFINTDFEDYAKYIAHCEDDLNKNELKELAKNDKKVVILIGPEGDFSSEEINLALEQKFIPVSLGKSRLRTETAGIVACHTLHVIS